MIQRDFRPEAYHIGHVISQSDGNGADFYRGLSVVAWAFLVDVVLRKHVACRAKNGERDRTRDLPPFVLMSWLVAACT